MKASEYKSKVKYLAEDNRNYPEQLILIDREDWPASMLHQENVPDVVWRSRHYLVQVFEAEHATRVSINRTQLLRSGQWVDGITWDEIQKIKGQIGFGEMWAVEVYPPDDQLIADHNIRHIWILDAPPPYAWRSR